MDRENATVLNMLLVYIYQADYIFNQFIHFLVNPAQQKCFIKMKVKEIDTHKTEQRGCRKYTSHILPSNFYFILVE